MKNASKISLRLFPVLLIGIGTALNTGCSPKIYTHLTKTYPSGLHGTDVRFFEPNDTLPDDADTLGTLRIRDTGFTVDCSYEKVIALAESETVKVGGNGFHITEHLRPSVLGSSCHRISGTMLYLPEGVRSETKSPQVSAGAPDEKLKNRSTFYANAGYGIIVSKVLLPEGSSGDPTRGFDFNVGYDYAVDPIWSIGAIYSQYTSSMLIPLDGHELVKDRIILQYIGAGVSAGGMLSHHWALRGSLGLGYAHYAEKALGLKTGVGGFGTHLMLDAEYRFNPHVGIGANLAGFSGRFRSELLTAEEDKTAAINRYSFSAGIRIHF